MEWIIKPKVTQRPPVSTRAPSGAEGSQWSRAHLGVQRSAGAVPPHGVERPHTACPHME